MIQITAQTTVQKGDYTTAAKWQGRMELKIDQLMQDHTQKEDNPYLENKNCSRKSNYFRHTFSQKHHHTLSYLNYIAIYMKKRAKQVMTSF